MDLYPLIDIHTHSKRTENVTITVQNIFPGEKFAAFTGRNFYSVGLHPWHIKSAGENNEMLRLVEQVLEFDHVIFTGECGLDKTTGLDFEEQMRVFRAQAYMAEEFEKPLIIHCVKAYNEVMVLNKMMHPQMPWIFHGYNGSLEITKQLASGNFLFSFGKILFKSSTKAIESFRYLPVEKIFFETDEFDDDLEKIYKRGAELKNIPVELIEKGVWENFNRIEKSLADQ